MKKIAVFLLSLLLVSSLYGRDRKDEFALTYSQFTVPQFAYVFGGVLGVAFSAGHFDFENPIMTGNLGLEYNHWVNNWFGFGGSVFGEYMTANTYSKDSDGNKTKNGTFDLGFASIMPTARFRWFDNPHFGMYSKIGAGLGLAFSGECQPVFSAQLSPVCMDFGGDSVRGFLELGVGMQGIVSLGIKKIF